MGLGETCPFKWRDPCCFLPLRQSYGKVAVPCFSPWGCSYIVVAVKRYLIGPNAALWVISLSWKHNRTAHEHFFKREETSKGETGHSKCLDSETGCFQTTLIHSMSGNEDILITENSPIICMLLLTNLFCWAQWAGHHLLPEIFFSSNLPPLRVPVK